MTFLPFAEEEKKWLLGDNLLVAPSKDSLQEMIKTCEEYASEHNLKFSTNIDPKKCKTKFMAFLFKQRDP